jgi:flagellar motor switch protein FliN/FliY
MSFDGTMDGGAGPMNGRESDHLPDVPEPRDQSAPIHPATPEPEEAISGMAEEMIRKTSKAVGELAEDVGGAVPVDLQDFPSQNESLGATSIGMLGDVDLDVRIELGRTQMLVEDVLRLTPDSVVELDKAAGDPVDIFVNGRHVARGEVLVLNENFCVRVSEIIGKATAGSEPA